MEDNETVELGGIQVPKAFKERWDELIASNKALKAQVLEAVTEVKEAKQAAEAASTAPNSDLEAAKARIAELESGIAKAEHAAILGADSMSEEDAEFYDYVQYQYSKVTPEEGKDKPSFKDWYGEAKTTNKVIVAAIKEKAGSNVETPLNPLKKEPKLAPRQLPSKTSTSGQEHVFDAEAISRMDAKTFKANQDAIKKQMSGK
jgi:hypothetical protein